MASYDFYNGYSIDDTDIDCGKIIVVDCEGNHIYKNVCELLDDCNYPVTQLSEQCVVDFFNNLNLETPGHILRVSAGGCIEAVDINGLIGGDDCTVKVDSNDGCGYLEDKLIACTPSSGPYIDITKTGTGENKQLTFCIGGAWSIDNFVEFDAISSASDCDNSGDVYVKVDKLNNKFVYTCEKKYFCQRNAVTDITCNEPKTGEATFFFTGFDLSGSITNHTPMLTGDASWQLIKAPKDGYYYVRFNTSIDCYYGVGSFRCFLWRYDDIAGSASIILDRDLGNEPQSLVLPNSVYPSTGLDIDHFNQYSMTAVRIIYLNEGDQIGMGTRVSTSTIEGVGGKIVLKAAVTAGGDLPTPPFPASVSVAADPAAITNFGMAYYTHSD